MGLDVLVWDVGCMCEIVGRIETIVFDDALRPL